MLFAKAIDMLKKHWLELLILFVFAVIFSSISFVNHYNFRTNALDLGMFNQAVYCFAHGQMNYFTLDFHSESPNYFADHFSPLTILYAPLYYLFGSWTLLVVQIIAILFGAVGCYRVCCLKLSKNAMRYFILIIFLAQWSITSALAFDFHNNVIAAMLLPWLYYYYLQSKKGAVLIVFLLMIIAKESVSLWLIFILIGFILEKGLKAVYVQWRDLLRFEVPLILFSAVYFYLTVFEIMPGLYGKEDANMISRIGYQGGSVGGLIKSVFVQPLDTFKMFFENTTGDNTLDGIKKEFHIVMLLSGGFAVLLRPVYLLMLIPIYVQKMLNGNSVYWGITGQYSIEFAPVIVLALIDLVRIARRKYAQYAILSLTLLSACVVHHRVLKSRKTLWYDRTTHDFTYSRHYDSGGLDVNFMNEQLSKLPAEIPLSVSANVAPHLSNRARLYQFPFIADAEMIVLITDKRSTYPLSREDFLVQLAQLKESDDFLIILEESDLLIAKRKVGK